MTRSIHLALLLAAVGTAHAQSPLPEWKLGASQQLTIGGDGSPRTEFLNIVGAWRLANGETVIVDRSTSEIRVFDARGGFLRAFGQKGGGPGEFTDISFARPFGDTAVIYDEPARRITKVLLAARPRVVGEVLMSFAEGREVWVTGRLNDGRWLLRGLAMPDPRTDGLYRIPGYVGVIDAGGKGATWLAELGDGSAFVDHDPRLSLKITAFPAALEIATTGSAIWFGDGATDTLVRLDPKTGARKSIRLQLGAPVTKRMVDDARARELADARDARARNAIEKRYSEKFLPKRLPTFAGLVGGPRGELWVERGTISRAAPVEYLVLSAAGVPIARVSAPAGFRATDIGGDYVVGIHRDEDGVETVRRYSLRR